MAMYIFCLTTNAIRVILDNAMNHLVFWISFAIGLAAMLWLASLSRAEAECLPSPQAVRDVHKGAWPLWSEQIHGHRGVKCWYANGFKNVEQRIAAQVPVPLPRPNPFPAAETPPPDRIADAFTILPVSAVWPTPEEFLLSRLEFTGWRHFLADSRARAAAVASALLPAPFPSPSVLPVTSGHAASASAPGMPALAQR